MNELMTMLGTGIETVETEVVNPAETLIIPTLGSLNIPKNPCYINGTRANVNSYGTVNLSGFKGTTDELIKNIGADFTAERIPALRMTKEGKVVPVKNNSFLVNSKTDEIIGESLTERYVVVQFDEAIYTFMALLDEVKKHGYSVEPSYAKVYGGGARCFLQYHIGGNKIMGEPVDSYLTLLSSHDKSMGFTIALSAVRAFCSNTINRLLKNATNKITLKHTLNTKNFIEARAQQLIRADEANRIALQEYCESLAKIKVTNQQVFDALSIMYNLNEMDSQRALNGFQYRAEQLFACMNMPDVSSFAGTALGAYYGFSDMSQHCQPLRKTADETYITRGIEGNVDLGRFADILVEVAK